MYQTTKFVGSAAPIPWRRNAVSRRSNWSFRCTWRASWNCTWWPSRATRHLWGRGWGDWEVVLKPLGILPQELCGHMAAMASLARHQAASGRRCWISLVLEAATRWPTAGLIRIIGAVMGTTSAHSWVARAWRPCHLMWQARHLTWRVDPPCIGPQGPLFVVNVKSLAFWTKARSFVRGWTDQKWLLGCPGKEVRIKG